MPESLKADTRSKRVKWVRKHDESSSTLPGNWQTFLRIDENKTELFPFLATRAAGIDTTKQVLTTHHVVVLCTNQQDISSLAPCTHAKADTRMLLYLEDAVYQGLSKVSIRTVDTDVVVLAITAAQCLNISELWVAFGVGNNLLLMRFPDDLVLFDVLHVMIDIFFGGRVEHLEGIAMEITSAFCALFSTPTLQTIEVCLGCSV